MGPPPLERNKIKPPPGQIPEYASAGLYPKILSPVSNYLSYTLCPTIQYPVSNYPVPCIQLSWTLYPTILYPVSNYPVPCIQPFKKFMKEKHLGLKKHKPFV